MTSESDLPAVSSPYPGPVSDTQQLHSQLPADDTPPAYQQPPYSIPQQVSNVNFDMAQPQGPVRPGPYNMAALANALPQANFRQGQFNPAQLRYNPSGSSSNIVGHSQPMPQYSGQPAMGHMPNQSYYMQQQPQMPPYYGSPISPSQPQANMSPRPNMSYYGNQVMTNHQSHPSMAYYYTQMPSYAPPGQPPHQGMPTSYMPGTGGQHELRVGPPPMGDIGDSGAFSPTQQESTRCKSCLDYKPMYETFANVVQHQPIASRMSFAVHLESPDKAVRCQIAAISFAIIKYDAGHAIWIGNLPAQTDLMSLVHHVCKEAEGLESLFLISKSNCAFANYKDESTCLAAQQKLHESKFQSVRLVSRLRKNTVEGASGVAAPTGPSATIGQQTAPSEAKESVTTETTEVQASRSDTDTPSVASVPEAKAPAVVDLSAQKDKFFILKSLTLEDLELSVRTGIWATQSHNEETLNTAFKVNSKHDTICRKYITDKMKQASENVYLVFSANKSGEYFGYARMVSTINEDPAAAIEFAPKAQSVSDVDLPREIPTEANESTPKGRIIDDSARGTIFWEVARDDLPDGQELDEAILVAADQDDASSGADGGSESKTWGKPFKLEWLCTTRLPFYRCRGLRNPWNSNREVKIARDGTELEPFVGRRLIGLFNRNHNSPVPRGPMMGMGQMMAPPPQPMAMGYPPPYS